MTVYGYARISRKQQSIERQIRNIKTSYPDATILQEAFTGTKINRPQWSKLFKRVKKGDTIVFDSVSRMSRNAEEGIKTYFDLYDRGIKLVFLKEAYINTDIYTENLKDKIQLQGTDEDEIFKGLNNYFRKLAQKQIAIAFEQSEKEVDDLHQRTKEGIETARINGKRIGQIKGTTLVTKKSLAAKEEIRKHSKDFDGTLNDVDCMKLVHLSRNTFYKYKKSMKEDI
jgi:DNA invertase Pin-like site-specific DNA recombinase